MERAGPPRRGPRRRPPPVRLGPLPWRAERSGRPRVLRGGRRRPGRGRRGAAAAGRVVVDHAARPELAHGPGVAVPHRRRRSRTSSRRRSLLELGRPHAARSVFTAAGTITLGVLGMWLAEVAILLGRHDEAAELLDAAEAHYRRLQDRGHLVECAYLRGRLAAAGGRPDAAALLGAAAAEAEALGMARVARLARSAAPRGPGPHARRRRSTAGPAPSGGRATSGSCASAASTPGCATRRGWPISPCCSPARASRSTSPSWSARPARWARRGSTQPVLDDAGDRRLPAAPAGPGRRGGRRRRRRRRRPAPPGPGPSGRRSPTSSPPTSASAAPPARRRTGSSGPARPSGAGSTPRSKRIEAEHPSAGRHLRRSVQTGAFCAYDPAEPVRWET